MSEVTRPARLLGIATELMIGLMQNPIVRTSSAEENVEYAWHNAEVLLQRFESAQRSQRGRV